MRTAPGMVTHSLVLAMCTEWMYATCIQHHSCDPGPGNLLAEASSSYSMQTDFPEGGPSCFSKWY